MNVRAASALGIAASVTSAVGLFLVFRVSIHFLGAAAFGSWVIIQSIFFLSRVAEGGVGLNLTRTYAVDEAQSGPISPIPYCIAGVMLTATPVAVLGLLLIWPAKFLLLHYFHTPIPAGVVVQLVLLSYLIAVLNALASVGMATVEGRGKLVWRHAGTIAANIVFVVGSYPLISRFGVVGLSILYALAAGMLVLISWGLVLHIYRRPGTKLPPTIFEVVKRIWRDGLNATGMVLVRTAFEPWTKFLVGSFGSLAAVAALELAFRATTQVRVLIQSATQPLLFLGARSQESMSERALETYSIANSLVVQANWSALALISCAAPFISFLGFGYLSSQTVSFLLILAVGNAINSMGVIGYYAEASGQGMGRLFRIHLSMMVVNVGVGLPAAFFLGPIGAVVSYALSFAYGGATLIRAWGKVSTISVIGLILGDRWIVAIGVLAVAASLMLAWAPLDAIMIAAGSAALTTIASALLAALYVTRWRRRAVIGKHV